MRKITQESVYHFECGKKFKKSNMEVLIENNSLPDGTLIPKFSHLLLHGNIIAIKNLGTKEIKISNCGWFSNTTKERLNGISGVSIKQHKGTWYLNGQSWDGNLIKI